VTTRQSFYTVTCQIQLINFSHNRFKSHESPLLLEAKEERTSDGLLSSENLKEDKKRRRPCYLHYHASWLVESFRTTVRSELWISISPLYLIKPSFLNRFMKKLTRDRVVPTISASIS
jgi:hypothetical protein